MIELRNISFTYNGESAALHLDSFNLSIASGETVLLCGESGCGKTTVTRLINGLIPHFYEGKFSGEVLVTGKKVNELPLYETAGIVGSVFQNPRSQFFHVDTTGELVFGCENLGMDEGEIQRRLKETVRKLQLETLTGRNIFRLSGGEKQRIACGSVSALSPEVIVLDEPSSNLDFASIRHLKEIIAEWKRAVL
jgi:energy-coupling factor transport system ATP-binding protein